MNRVMLKQLSKKKEKEKAKKKVLDEPIVITKAVIKMRLINLFKNHIGESDKVLREEIFQAVVGITADAVNNFSAFYFWGQIEKVIRELRKKRICFVMKKKGAYFIANDMSDIDYFEAICEKAKDGMDATVEWGREWIEQEKWKDFENYEGKDFIEPKLKPKKPATIEDKINHGINNAKTKVVKLWKGEK